MIFSGPWYSSHFLFHKSNFLPKTTSLEKTLLFSTGIYISLAWLYLHCTWLYNTLCWLYFTSHNSRSTFLPYYFTLYLNLPYCIPWLYFTLLYSSAFYHCSTLHYFTSLNLTLHYCTVDILYSTWHYNIIPLLNSTMVLLYTLLESALLYKCLYFTTLLDSTTFYHGSTSLYSFYISYYCMGLLHSTWQLSSIK